MKNLAVMGYPLGHTLSPVLHNHLYDRLGIDAQYEALETPPDGLEAVATRLRTGELTGINITRPHKSAFVAYLDDTTPDVTATGAVNCVSVEGAGLRGHNTDLAGIAYALSEAGCECQGRQALVLGAGGAARAAVVALNREGVSAIRVAARNETAAAELVQSIPPEHRPVDFRALPLTVDLDTRPFELLVNATPVGQWPQVDDALLSTDQLHPGQVVLDMVYHPEETLLLRQARARGCLVASGLDMFIGQALASFEIWFPGSTGFGTGRLQAGIATATLKELLLEAIKISTDDARPVNAPEVSA